MVLDQGHPYIPFYQTHSESGIGTSPAAANHRLRPGTFPVQHLFANMCHCMETVMISRGDVGVVFEPEDIGVWSGDKWRT